MNHSSGFLNLVNDSKSRIKECSIDELEKMISTETLDGLLIDTREENEFANGFIQNAIHISKGVIESCIESTIPNKNQKMYFYCGGGFRSALVADTLQNMGYKNVISVDGGFREWKSKYPLSYQDDFRPKEFLMLVNSAKSQVKEINVDELYNLTQEDKLDGVIVDVREDSEFARFYIPGAIHISKGQLEVKIEKLIPNKEQKIYLYCAGGFRSAISALSLQKMGYTNAINVTGGVQAWISSNYPLAQE